MSLTPCKYIAIDVSKATLECRWEQKTRTLGQTPKGHAELLKLAQGMPGAHVVLEATGGYEREVMQVLWDAAIPVSRIEPGRIRGFARSEGIKAKTDPIDTLVIYRFAEAKAPPPTPAPSATEQAIAAWMDRRQQLKEEITREKNRIQNCSKLLHKSHEKHLRFLEKEVAVIEATIKRLIKEDPAMTQKQAILTEVVGVGAVTAQTLLAFLPQLGQASSRHLNGLVGLAPHPRDSGKKKGKRSIQGGRAKVRRGLYMAALTASQHNPVLRDYYSGLVGRGIVKKSARVAVMRKLLNYLNLKMQREYYSKKSLAA